MPMWTGRRAHVPRNSSHGAMDGCHDLGRLDINHRNREHSVLPGLEDVPGLPLSGKDGTELRKMEILRTPLPPKTYLLVSELTSRGTQNPMLLQKTSEPTLKQSQWTSARTALDENRLAPAPVSLRDVDDQVATPRAKGVPWNRDARQMVANRL
ncbi:hypothetical protein CIHG_01365 [Coccidioides immitis H538.4]|uniref:Uncharacterized protein n=2 Tax=Coccidioides immitis TaxID=5501 RepID=A0A0J8RF69_COCIT|nr:hypothetical protein CIRG_01215 [Coccidioides immitis RMSCC 2394]KMU83582.1 hypothetical protein CIHG_01365 [Coccidioides immitis H538.4]